MAILAIDPGPSQSAWMVWSGSSILEFAKQPNAQVLEKVIELRLITGACVIEKIANMGMAVGQEVFETVYWMGRFAERYGAERVVRVPRNRIKLHHCLSSRAKDANVRQAIIDRFGGKEKAIGKKAWPGPLYGISGDCWSALAVALWFWDSRATVQVAKEAWG